MNETDETVHEDDAQFDAALAEWEAEVEWGADAEVGETDWFD